MQVYQQSNQDYRIQDGFTQSSTVIRIQNLQLALERAIEDISLLQGNLAYVIRIKQELEAQLQVKQKRQETLLSEFQKELTRKQKQIQNLKMNHEELASLLESAKLSLQNYQIAQKQREDQHRRLERIIDQQRSNLHSLQEELLAVKYTADLSYQNVTVDNIRLQQLQRQIQQLQFDNQKLKSQCEREITKGRRWQREVDEFKRWLGGVLGVRKVVEGCQKMLMEEIANRLTNCSKI